MTLSELYWLWNADDDEASGYLNDNEPVEDDIRHRPATESDLSMEAIASYLDQRAEDCNKHDFCGVHQALMCLMEDTIGGKQARAVMRALLESNGLHEMGEP